MADTHVHMPYEVTEAELVEKAKLKKHFGRFDILFFLICTLVGVDTIGTVASNGAEAFTWLMIMAAIFFIPSALLFAELGTAFPEEGGPYVWVRLAFGRLPGAINNFLYWVTNPVWLGGTLAVSAAAVFATFFTSSAELDSIPFYIFTLIFVWVGVLAAILSFSVGKWIPTTGAWSRFLLLGFFTVSVIIYAFQNGIHGFGLPDFAPTTTGMVLLLPVLMFQYVGFELPSSAGDEMKNPQRDVPWAIFGSATAAVILYGVPILGILLVLPTDQVTNLGGFIDAMKSVFTVYGGSIAEDGTATLTGLGAVIGDFSALLFILALLSSGVAWIMGSDRALAVSGFDGAAPRYLGVISERFGTPVRVNVFSGILSTLVLIGAHEVTGGNAEKLFTTVLGLAISTTLVSYIGIFPALAVLRKKLPGVARPYRAPAATLLSVGLTILILFATVQLFFPGLGIDWFGDDFRPSAWGANEKWQYLLTELVPLTFFIICGVLFWVSGKSTRMDLATQEEIDAAPIA
ncbi:MAG: APC family permease [Actinomycetes bacterium]